MTMAYFRAEANALLRPVDRDHARRARHAWAMHALGLVPVVLIVKFVFAMPFGAYLVAVYCAQSVLAVRSFCEHRWAEKIAARSVIVEKSVLGLLFLNNNLHVVHHAHPGLPWHALPAAYRAPPRGVADHERRLCLPRLPCSAAPVRLSRQGAGATPGQSIGAKLTPSSSPRRRPGPSPNQKRREAPFKCLNYKRFPGAGGPRPHYCQPRAPTRIFAQGRSAAGFLAAAARR